MPSKTIIAVLSLASILITGCSAQKSKPPEKFNERWYQSRWCEQQQGKAEVRLDDKTRCDCLTSDYAIEVDFAYKWAEAIGQSLHYSKMTGERAGILLIVEKKNDEKHLRRLNNVIAHHHLPIRVWTTNQQALNELDL